jgi:hypothetical protein
MNQVKVGQRYKLGPAVKRVVFVAKNLVVLDDGTTAKIEWFKNDTPLKPLPDEYVEGEEVEIDRRESLKDEPDWWPAEYVQESRGWHLVLDRDEGMIPILRNDFIRRPAPKPDTKWVVPTCADLAHAAEERMALPCKVKCDPMRYWSDGFLVGLTTHPVARYYAVMPGAADTAGPWPMCRIEVLQDDPRDGMSLVFTPQEGKVPNAKAGILGPGKNS